MPVPAVKNRSWPRNEIDHFILARLEKEGIKPSPEADKTRWLRRVTYDLTGLPPTPGESRRLPCGQIRRNLMKALLTACSLRKHFGERMAVPWLDAARYADSYGYQSDQLCPTWPYRDWVVQAFNDNLPYDKFLTEQLAGDLLPHATRSTAWPPPSTACTARPARAAASRRNGAPNTSPTASTLLAPRFSR